MKHRIAAGALVVEHNKVLLVRHRKPGAYDFWVAPGGGAEDTEDLHSALRREVREECGLLVEPVRIAYIEDLSTPTTRECKIWFTPALLGASSPPHRPKPRANSLPTHAFCRAASSTGRSSFLLS